MIMQLQCYKYQGTGNDFVLIDNREKTISLTEGKNKIDFSAETLPSGIYFANIKFANNSTTKKFIVK